MVSPAALGGAVIVLVVISGVIIYRNTFDPVNIEQPPVVMETTTPAISPSVSASASVAPTAKATGKATTKPSASASTQAKSNVHIEGFQPWHAAFGATVTLNGSGFGNNKGSIALHQVDGRTFTVEEILSWSDSSIRFVNVFPIEGRDATIKGINLKNADRVYFYEENNAYIGKDIGTSGILEKVGDGEIRYNVPTNLAPGKRYKMSVMSKYGTYGGLMSFTAGG